MIALSACGGADPVTGPDREELIAAERRWAQSAPAAYQFTMAHSCFCGPEYTRAVIVSVRNGQVERRRYEDTGADVSPLLAGGFPAIEGLFDIIERSLASGDAQTDVVYDPERGIPTSIAIDGSVGTADDEMFIGTRDFLVR